MVDERGQEMDDVIAFLRGFDLFQNFLIKKVFGNFYHSDAAVRKSFDFLAQEN